MEIRKIFNANVYIDGTNSLLGRAREIVLPNIAVNVEEHKALGMIGALELPVGLAPLVTTITWAGWYADRFAHFNPFRAHKLQVRASVETFGAGGRVSEQALVVVLTAAWKNAPLGTLAAGAGGEVQDELATTYVRVALDGDELFEVDVNANIWRVNGEDLLEQYRANLGV